MRYTNEEIVKRKKTTEKIKNLVTVLIYIIIIPFVIYTVTLLIQSLINPNQTPSFFGIKTYVIVSGSMEPELNIGDIAVVKETSQNELQIGDIISFRQGQSVVTHRIYNIIEKDGVTQYETKGDNNNAKDPWIVEYELIEGKQSIKIPYIGNFILFLQDGYNIIIIILLIYLYFLISGNSRRKKNERNIKRIEYEEQNKLEKEKTGKEE